MIFSEVYGFWSFDFGSWSVDFDFWSFDFGDIIEMKGETGKYNSIHQDDRHFFIK